MKRDKVLKVGKNWTRYDYQVSRHVESCCEKVGLPTDIDMNELLKHFGIIEEVFEVECKDSRIICEMQHGKVIMTFLNSITFSGGNEIWIESKTGVKKYLVVPEMEEIIEKDELKEVINVPWYTIYLGSNVYAGDKSLLTHIDETTEGSSIGNWTIKKKGQKILEVYIKSAEYEIYCQAQAIEDYLSQYLQKDADLDASEIYCGVLNALRPGKNLEKNDSEKSDSEESEPEIDEEIKPEIDIEKNISININVWDENEHKKSSIVQSSEELDELILTLKEGKIALDSDGTLIWQKGKNKVIRLCMGNKYKVEMELLKVSVNAEAIQNLGDCITDLIEQAEIVANKYSSLFE